MQTQHGCCWFQAEATFFASEKTRRADFDTEVKICTALGIAAIAFLPFVLSSSNFCSEYGKTLRLYKATAKSYKRKARPCCFTTIYKNSKTTG